MLRQSCRGPNYGLRLATLLSLVLEKCTWRQILRIFSCCCLFSFSPFLQG